MQPQPQLQLQPRTTRKAEEISSHSRAIARKHARKPWFLALSLTRFPPHIPSPFQRSSFSHPPHHHTFTWSRCTWATHWSWPPSALYHPCSAPEKRCQARQHLNATRHNCTFTHHKQLQAYTPFQLHRNERMLLMSVRGVYTQQVLDS